MLRVFGRNKFTARLGNKDTITKHEVRSQGEKMGKLRTFLGMGCSYTGLHLLRWGHCDVWLAFSSVTELCPTLCDPMNHSMPGLPFHHQLPESTQTHVHWVSDVIQPSHPLSSPSPLALNLSQHQGFSNELALRIRWPKYWSFSLAAIRWKDGRRK